MENKITPKEILKGLISKLDLTDFRKDKLRVHLGIYILQSAGLKLGYGFSLGDRAPYSTELFEDYWDITQSNLKSAVKFEKNCLKKINEVKKLFISPFNLQELELLCFSHYILENWNRQNSGMFQEFKEDILNQRPNALKSIKEEDLKKSWVNAANLIAYKQYYDNMKNPLDSL